MFISYAASAADGFEKWSAAHPASKYTCRSNKPARIAPAISDTSALHAGGARSSPPIAVFRLSAIHVQRAMRLRQTAGTAPVGGPLEARLLDLALQYDRMAADSRHGAPEARQMRDE